MSVAIEAVVARLPSMVPEERRGFPGAARELALDGARENPSHRAEWTLWAVYASLQAGEPRYAMRLLDELPAEGSEVVLRRARASRAWAQMLDRNWYPDDEGGELPPGFFSDIVSSDVVMPGDPETVLLENCAANGPRMLLTLRNVVSGAARKSPALAAQMVVPCIQTLDRFVGIANSIGAYSAMCWAFTAKADLLARAGRLEEAQQQLAELRKVYAQANDGVGLANTWLVEGDWSATPGSRPEALGLALTEEAAPLPSDAERALYAYQQAAGALASGRAPRLEAALALRFALLAGRAGRFEEQRAQLEHSDEAFASAGDAAGRHLVKVHRWLADLERGELVAVRRSAPLEWGEPHGPVAEIVKWAADRGSITYCTGLGRLLHRSGERWASAGEFERAELAYRLASHLVVVNGAVPTWTIPHALSALDLQRNFTTRGLARQLQLLDRMPAPRAPAQDDPTWMYDLQLTIGLLSVPTGVSGTGEMAERILERAANRVTRLLEVAGVAPVDVNLAVDSEAALESVKATIEAELSARLQGNSGSEAPIEQMISLAFTAAQDAIGRARPLLCLLQARRHERLGADVNSDSWYEAALEACAGGGPELRWLEILVLNAWDKSAEAREKLQAATLEREVPVEILARLAALVRDYATARRLYGLLPSEPDPADWRSYVDRTAAEADGGDLARALELATRGMRRFEATLAGLARDADRVAACDDISAASLYMVAARVQLRLASDAEQRGDEPGARTHRSAAFALTERHRALTLPPEAASNPVLLQWQQTATEHTTAYQRLLLALTLGAGDVSTLAEVVAAAERSLADLEASLLPEQQRAIAEARQPVSFAAEDVQRNLPDGACLLEYQVVGREYLAFAITRSSVAVWEGRCGRSTFDGLASRLLRACRTGDPSDDAHMLSTLLLEPFADVLRANERVFVTASGALNSLPFHVLPFDGRPLGETHVLSLLPAASLLARSRADQPLARGEVTIVGDPAFDPELRPALPRLPGAAVEARAVARLYEVEEPLVGETATEPALRPLLCGRAMLHIAAHGHLDDIAPNTSSIVLAGPDELTVSDLIGLHVTADLAVLSACDTGRGTTTLGGDLVGLARGLFAAGVRRCIVSLWPVDDVAACVTMLAFHKALRSAGGVAPAHALAAAQREVRGLSNAELADRYHSLGGTLTVERRSIRRAPPPSLPDYADADTDDDADDESLSSQRASIWAPFVLIGA